jgi:hypothetical protein
MNHPFRHAAALAALLAVAGVAQAADVPADAAQPGLRDYSCWSLLTEPEETVEYSEVFYLGYALGEARAELADEVAYKRVMAAAMERCRAQPDMKVLEAFADAIRAG